MSKLTLTGLALPLFLLFASPAGERPKGFRRYKKSCPEPGAERDASKDDRRKRKRHNGSRSQPIEWNRLRAGKTDNTAIRCRGQFLLSAFWSLTIFCAARTMVQWHWSRKTPRSDLPAVAKRFHQATRSGKTSFGRSVRSCRARRQDRDSFSSMSKAVITITRPMRHSLSITGGRLLVSNEFAKALGRPSDAGSVVGQISLGATMESIEINHLDENGNVTSASLPALKQPGVGTVPGPDVIVGESA